MSSTSQPPDQPSEPSPSSTSTSTSSQDQPQPSDPSDSSDPSRRPRRPRPKHDFPETQAGKLWKAFENPPGGPINELPGGTYNTAGGHPRELSAWDQLKHALRYDQFNQPNRPAFYQSACARDSLLVGIAAGGGLGGIRFILRGLSGMMLTTNLAVVAFAGTSCGMFAWCNARRREEARGMAVAVAGMRMLNEKKAREKEEEQERERIRLVREVQEVEERKARERKWWKPW